MQKAATARSAGVRGPAMVLRGSTEGAYGW